MFWFSLRFFPLHWKWICWKFYFCLEWSILWWAWNILSKYSQDPLNLPHSFLILKDFLIPFFLLYFFFFVFLLLFLILFLRVEHNSFKMYSRARLIDHFLAPTPNEPEKSFFVCWTICYRWRSLLIDSFFSTSKLQNLGKISRKIQHIRKGNSILELFAFFFCRIGANVKVN